MGSSQSSTAAEINPDLGFEVNFNSKNIFSCKSYEDVFTSLLSSKLHRNSHIVSRVPPGELKAFCDELLVDLVAKSDLLIMQFSVAVVIAICVVLYVVAGIIAFIVVSLIGSFLLFFVLENSLVKKRIEAIANTIVKFNISVFKPRGILVSEIKGVVVYASK